MQVVDRLSDGHVEAVAQDPAGVTYAPKVTKDEGALTGARHAKTIHDKVRGLQPWPLASTMMAGRRYVIRKTVVDSGRRDCGAGTIVRAHGDVLAVAAGDRIDRSAPRAPARRAPVGHRS